MICGIGPGIPGFGTQDKDGAWKGLGAEFCQAIAVEIFNDPSKVKYIPLSSRERFAALQSGEIDLLALNTTWTMSRDTVQGMNFPATYFYDGQGFMVKKSANIDSALKLNGASICLQQGTTSEINVADFFRLHKMKYEVIAFSTADEALKAYEAGRCDTYSTDRSGLYAERTKLNSVGDHVVLPEIISKEPLGPVVRQGDEKWTDLVRWTVFAMVSAEELGVTRDNVERMKSAENPDIRRLLGTEGAFGQGLGLTNDWAYRVIRTIGNYGEWYERNIGRESLLKIDRGANALWRDGGLQYAAPIR